MSTTVIHVSEMKPGDIYIGRYNRHFNLPQHQLANPFKIGSDGTREEVIKKYEDYLLDHPELMFRYIPELKGHRLACWCHPLACHGDLLAEWAEILG